MNDRKLSWIFNLKRGDTVRVSATKELAIFLEREQNNSGRNLHEIFVSMKKDNERRKYVPSEIEKNI